MENRKCERKSEKEKEYMTGEEGDAFLMCHVNLYIVSEVITGLRE